MKIQQIYTGCLAQGAYYIESNGEAAIIDPLREVQPYIDLAESRNSTIKYIFETHFHADFVSGHVDLAKKTGAAIIYGPTQMKTGFDCIIGKDNQLFNLGEASIRLIHTPGHTMESSCFLLIDEKGKETALFTGDTLFIGDVGRPDLAQYVIADLTQEKLGAIPMLLPEPDEQKWIVGRFDAIDKLIQSEQLNLYKLSQQKHGLMHDLLTGHVRVKVPEAVA